MAVVDDSNIFMIDDAYEFSAPRFFDFINGESEEDMCKAELWFETSLSYAPSPFMPRIKTGRSVQLESLCDFTEAEQLHKPSESSEKTTTLNIIKESIEPEKDQSHQTRPPVAAEVKEGEVAPTEAKEELGTSLVNLVSDDKRTCEATCTQENGSFLTGSASSTMKVEPPHDKDNDNLSTAPVGAEACTPRKPPTISRKVDLRQTDSKKHQTAKNIARMVRNPSALKSKNQLQLSQAKSIKPASVRRDTNVKNTGRTPNFAQENQAIKRQKLEGGRSRQILSLRIQNLPHKSRTGLISSSSNLCFSTVKTHKEQRKVYFQGTSTSFCFNGRND
ncbi:hypothetical protein F0562_010763 [Nyssa sinensis]|uniref:TPX2 central domain-containing protein n=1 Tax=Nyssa sinensis TaxID=561372 RepID=A0A5J5A1L4_9ASTE|nr:hypothetical protein F0562_010763 [Nyssa sinensis]